MLGDLAMEKLLEANFESVLDIGCGRGEATKLLLDAGKKVHACDAQQSGYYALPIELKKQLVSFQKGFFEDLDFPEKFDAVWCSHVLEHVKNPHDFLKEIKMILKEDGILCITVPPLKHDIVSGHVSLWNAGLLLYHLVLAGFNCSDAKVRKYGYNISVICRNKSLDTKIDFGNNLQEIAEYFPKQVLNKNGKIPPTGFNGDIEKINWGVNKSELAKMKQDIKANYEKMIDNRLEGMIPLSKCVHGYIYHVNMRNGICGIYNETTKGFIFVRTKFTSKYLFEEYHWDTGEPYGTAIPYSAIGKINLPKPLKINELDNETKSLIWNTWEQYRDKCDKLETQRIEKKDKNG